jgi:hypothetical protein
MSTAPRPEQTIAQKIGEKPVYHISDMEKVTGSRATAYRLLKELLECGFADRVKEGYFTLRSCLFQPYKLWQDLMPSLQALKQSRFFGLSYNENDVRKARQILEGMVTLDYRAYELTGFQHPNLFSIYVDNVDRAAGLLRRHGFFSEGTRGRVAILPRMGNFENEVQRVYLDCIAFGGRSMLDAIAIDLLHGEKLDPKTRGTFKTEDVLKVRDEIAAQSLPRSG